MLTFLSGRAFRARRLASALPFLVSLALPACGEWAGDATSSPATPPADATRASAQVVEPAVSWDPDAPVPDAGAPERCTVGNRAYEVGDTFHDALRCNTCSCTPEGVVCTAKFCDPREACVMGDRAFAAGTNIVCEDGCNRCECVTRGWTTTLALCSALPKVERCSDEEAAGVARTEVLYRKDDALALSIGTGGCQNEAPSVKLCWDGKIAESLPVQMRLRVVPTKPTACSGWVTLEKAFDLSPLKEAYRASYPGLVGVVRVQIGNESVDYAF